MKLALNFAVGGLFGLGLFISGMTDTRKVIGWLDVFGAWDPTLAFVLGGAIIPMAIAWRLMPNPPPRPDPSLDRRLIAGSVLFGMGWGLSGLCPGPAMASLTWGGAGGLVFFVAMCAGMIAQPPLTRVWTKAAS